MCFCQKRPDQRNTGNRHLLLADTEVRATTNSCSTFLLSLSPNTPNHQAVFTYYLSSCVPSTHTHTCVYHRKATLTAAPFHFSWSSWSQQLRPPPSPRQALRDNLEEASSVRFEKRCLSRRVRIRRRLFKHTSAWPQAGANICCSMLADQVANK